MLLKLKKIKNNSASVSLETMIALTLFFFFVLFLYSIIVLFLAYNSIANALLQTSQSLSLDPVCSEALVYDFKSDVDKKIIDINKIPGLNGLKEYGLGKGEENKTFRSDSRWYKEGKNPKDNKARSNQLKEAVRERFIAYFANGVPEDAEKKAKLYAIVDGFNGLDFGKSKVENGKITVVVNYKLSYMFNFYNVSDNEIEQKAESKIWLLK